MGFFNKILGGNTLYYPGCLTKFAGGEMVERYKKILEAEGIDFVLLEGKELCCGSPVKNAGAKKEYHDLVRKNFEVFKEHSIDRIITNCPACTLMLRKEYPKILGADWRIEVKHMTEIINKSKSKLKNPLGPPLKKGEEGASRKQPTATYHDPCHLGRQLGIYDQPREIIKSAGYKLIEMDLHGEKSFCCGGGGGVNSNEPKLSEKIATDRIDQAKSIDVDLLVTPCLMCFMHLRNNSDGLKVVELSELFEFE